MKTTPKRIQFEPQTVVRAPLYALENAHWRPSAAKLCCKQKGPLKLVSSLKGKDHLPKLKKAWAREETWVNHGLNALFMALPEHVTSKVLADCCGESLVSQPEVFKLDYAGVRRATGDPDFILRDHKSCVLGESKVAAHSKSHQYSFQQFTKYMTLAAICECSRDSLLRRRTSHIIVVPSLEHFCSDHRDWHPLVANARLRVDPANMRDKSSGGRSQALDRWLVSLREVLLDRPVRVAGDVDETLVAALVERARLERTPVIVPTYVVTWKTLMESVRSLCATQGFGSLATAASTLLDMACPTARPFESLATPTNGDSLSRPSQSLDPHLDRFVISTKVEWLPK